MWKKLFGLNHSNETSLLVLSSGTVCFSAFYKMKLITEWKYSQLSGWLTLFHRSGPTIWMQLHHHPKHLPASQNNLFSLHSSLCQMLFEGLRKARRCWVRTSIVLLFKSMSKFTTFKPFTPEPPKTTCLLPHPLYCLWHNSQEQICHINCARVKRYFNPCYSEQFYINRGYYMAARGYKISLWVLKNISLIRCAHS